MLAELGMVLGDSSDRLADGAGHTGSSALGRGRGSTNSTAQANGAREFSKQEVAFGVGLGGPLTVADGVRLLDVVVDLGEASAVRVLGSPVAHLPGVVQCRTRQAGWAAVDECDAAGLGGDEIQHVELSARVGDQPRQVMHALGVTGRLRRSLTNTNCIESMISITRTTTGRVKHWRDGTMKKRWIAAGMLEAERAFRRLKGHADMPTCRPSSPPIGQATQPVAVTPINYAQTA